jgi:hypothetical protein
MNTQSEPTNCQTCNTSLQDKSYRYVYNEDTDYRGGLCLACDSKEMLEKYRKDGQLETHLVLDNSQKLFYADFKKNWYFEKTDYLEEMRDRIAIQLSVDKITKKIKEFEEKVWFRGLQEIVMRSEVSGVSAKLKSHSNFYVLTFSSAARTMITIGDESGGRSSTITALTEEKSSFSRMGFQGIDAREGDAIYLLDTAILLHKKGKLPFKEDSKVSMF